MQLQKKLIFIGILNLLILLALFFSGIFAPVEYKIYDTLFKLRGKRTADPQIVVIAIDDKSLETLKLQWPFSRTYFAKSLLHISADQPKAIALDFIFSENTNPKADEILSDALTKILPIPVISGVHLFQEVSQEPNGKDKLVYLETGERLPIFPQMHYGYINIFTDDDGFIRKTDLTREYEKTEFDFFTLSVLKFTHPNLYQYYKSQKKIYSLINFTGPDKNFQRISFYQVLKDLVPKGFFKDKIVLIGPTFKDSKDFHSTPFLDYDDIKTQMAGIEIHANILENLIHNQFYKEVPESLNLTILMFLNTLVFFLFFLNLNFGKLIFFELLSIILFYVFILLQIFLFHTVFNGFLPAFTCLIMFIILLIIQQIHKNKEMEKELDDIQSTDLYAMEAFCKKYDITKREKDIILLIINNYNKPQISKKLFISANTVKRHIYNIYKKTNAENREELVKLIK